MKERWRKVKRCWIYEIDGAGHVFHMDVNNKLKRLGFAIHGCIDCIAIANYYLDFISRSKFCPKVVRMDRGNENIYCEDLQVFLIGDPESFYMPSLQEITESKHFRQD